MLNFVHLLSTLALMGLGVPELLVILFIVIVIFGASKLPQLGRGLGEGIRNFKQGMKSEDDGKDRLEEARESGSKEG